MADNQISKLKIANGDTYEIVPEKLQSNGYTVAPPTVSKDSTLALTSDIPSLGDTTFKNGTMSPSSGLMYVDGVRPDTGHSLICGNGVIISNPATFNDQGWIRVTGTGENDTCFEIGTGDDGAIDFNIHFRQYDTSNNVTNDIVLPKDSGTVALTKNIPDISGKLDKSSISVSGTTLYITTE